MRWILFALVTALTSVSINASEYGEAGTAYSEASTPFATNDAAVVIMPIPTPAQITILESDLSFAPEISAAQKLKAAKKLKQAKKQELLKSMLSRTERQQIALLGAKPKGSSPDWSGNDDGGSDADDIVLHRSFSRPKVAESDDEPTRDRDQFVSEDIKVRLYLARMKAVEAHALANVPEPEENDAAFSDSVKLRLLLARKKALEAHQNKFS